MASLQNKKVTGSIQEKRGSYYIVVNVYEEGKRKPRWVPTGLPVKGYNKRQVEDFKGTLLAIVSEFPGEDVLELGRHIAGGGSISNWKSTVTFEPVGPVPSPSPVIRPSPRRTEKKWPGEEIPFVQHMENWIARMKAHVKINTWESYHMHVTKRIIPYFEPLGLMLAEIEPHHVQDFYDHCLRAPRMDGKEGTISSSSLRRIHACVCKALNDAIILKLIPSNVSLATIKPKSNVFHAKPYTAEQVRLFLAAAKGDLAEVPLVLEFFFGLRRSEALGVKLGAIDLETNRLTISHTVTISGSGKLIKSDITKTKKSHRTLPIAPEIRQYFKRLLRIQEGMRELIGSSYNPEGYLCVKPDGALIHPNTVSKHYKAIAKRAGVPVNRNHDARHTAASQLVKSGHNMKEIQKLLGHSDIMTTGNLYSHLEVDDLIDACGTITSQFGGMLPDEEDAAEQFAS